MAMVQFNVNKGKIILNSEHIISVEDTTNGSTILLTNTSTVMVKESADNVAGVINQALSAILQHGR